MGKIFFTKLTRGIMLSALVLAFFSCEDDYEPVYFEYGLVNKSEDSKFSITLDNGFVVYPEEHTTSWDDSTRVFIGFNILSERDSSADINLLSADTILTKSILDYKEDEVFLDSIGNDPIKIINKWFAHGFLNLEFTYYGASNLVTSGKRHMVNLLQHPTEDGKYVFEFCHNDFNDRRETLYWGRVSFPIAKILEGVEKPVSIILKYSDSSTSDRSVEIIYK